MSKKDYDKKIFRLISILNKLEQEGKISTRELAEEFNVSIRSIQRDLILLDTAGFRTDAISKGVYKFIDGMSLKKTSLSAEEASLVTFLGDVAGALGGNLQKSFQGIKSKLLGAKKASPYYMKIPELLNIEASKKKVLNLLKVAICDEQKVDVEYISKQEAKNTVLRPYKIVIFEGFWYLLAMDEKDEKIKTFGLFNIQKASLLNEYFDQPDNIQEILDQSVNVWFSGRRNIKVDLKISKDAAGHFKKVKMFPTQKIIKQYKDGSILLSTKISNFQEIIYTIYKWIPNIVIVSPKELKEEVENNLKSYLGKA